MIPAYEDFDRIVIVGGPRCGKSKLAERLERVIWHTDDMIMGSLNDSGVAIAQWFERPGPWVIEGVTATTALEYWFACNGYRPPCDCVLALWKPVIPLNRVQQNMLRHLRYRWSNIQASLAQTGVSVRDVVIQGGCGADGYPTDPGHPWNR
jgi:hypothetical protein